MQNDVKIKLIEAACAAGLHLVPIPPVNGQPSKAPHTKGWNLPYGATNSGGHSTDPDRFRGINGANIGLYHDASLTLAMDIDDRETAARLLADIADISLADWLADPGRTEIKSPRPNRGKLLFRLPADAQNIGLRQLKHDGQVIFELRCGNCQDVIFGRHPDGGEYEFFGNPSPPPIPDVLLSMIQHWDEWLPCFRSALGVPHEPPAIAPRKPQQHDTLPGRRDPIQEFNQARGCSDVLLADGYKPAGRDRFIRPNSSSHAPGVAILRDCADGVERVFSHGGDVLNDGFAHDAFDCYRILECGGDFDKALNWNSELTKHNQRLYMREKAAAKQAKTKIEPNESEQPEAQLTELPEGVFLEESQVEILEKINAEHAHAVIGGKHVIVGKKLCQVQSIVPSFEFPGEFYKRFVHLPMLGIGKKKKTRGQAWFTWHGKRYFPRGAGFYPDPAKCPDGVFNFFNGYRVKPMAGDCTLYTDHIHSVICAGDSISSKYVIQWMAHIIQKPDEKPNVAIVLKSVEGTGKGAMVEPLLSIFGMHGNKTNGAYAISGRFNGVVTSKLLLVADEVDLTDAGVFNKLKSVITEPTVNMERKGLEMEPIANYCRLIFTSNNTKVLNAGIRERRYLVLEPSDARAQDTTYFKTLWGWIKNGGAGKLLHYLMSVDISDFDPYKCPQTKALIAEKLENLGGINSFFHNEIIKFDPFGGKTRIRAHDLVTDYMAWSLDAENTKINEATARSSVGRMMSRLGIEVQGRSDRGIGKYYDMPARNELIQLFSRAIDIPADDIDPL